MIQCIRFIALSFCLLIIPFNLFGIRYQSSDIEKDTVLTDSFVNAQLEIIDSLISVQTHTANKQAENLLNGLLSKSFINKDLEYELIFKKCKFLQRLSRNEESIDYINELIKNGYTVPNLYNQLAIFNYKEGDYSKSISNTLKAILLFQKEGDLFGKADAVSNLIVYFGDIGMFEEAETYFNENIQLCNRINFKEGLVSSYTHYGESLVFENPELSYELLQQALNISFSIGRMSWCEVSISLARFYVNTSQLQLAKHTINEYLNNCRDVNIVSTSNVYTLMAHVYSLEKNIDSTIFYNEKALKYRIQSGNKLVITSSYLNLAGNYLAKEEIVKANEYLEKAEAEVFESKNPQMLLYYYRGKVKYFEFIKDFTKAYQYSQKGIEFSGDLTTQRHQSVLSKINASFEIQQKNILLERELEKRKAATRLVIFSIIGVILLASGIYALYLYRKKTFSYLRLKSRALNIEKKLTISIKEKQKFQSVFEYSATGILILDKKGHIQYANRRSLYLLGKKDYSEILYIPFSDYFEDDFKTKIQKALKDVFIKKQADKGFKVNIVSQNNFHWLDLSFAPLFFQDEEDNILISIIDVTQEVISIEKEQKQKQELQTLLNSVTESILFIQRDGTIKAINNAVSKRLLLKPKELIGANYFDILPEIIAETRIIMFKKVLRTKKPMIEIESIGNFNNLVSMYPNINLQGEVDYISEFVQDITEQKIAEEEIDKLKQSVLRSQMNPHFIFNSLTSIQSFVLLNDAGLASKYLNSFARLIRLILEASRQDYISLKNEIAILNYYLEIQKMRFSDKFSYSFDLDPNLDIEQIKIPPMIAQPFIENSIEHGIQHMEKMGKINISFMQKENRLLFELSDNGIGRDASRNLNKENVFASKSLSTTIINDRLHSLNKNAKHEILYNIIDLKDDFNQANGTRVIISIPIETF